MTASTASPYPKDVPDAGVSDGFTPVRIMEIELTRPLPAVHYNSQYPRLWVLGRLHGVPVGACVIQVGLEGLTSDEFGALLWPEYREQVTEHYAAAGLSAPCILTGNGLETDLDAWPFLQHRMVISVAAPFISVVICTRDRPRQLETCLRSLGRQEYPSFEVIVVDNAPSSTVRAIVDAGLTCNTVRYVPESRSGLSWARNAGIAAASGEIIAFLDDDEEPDRHWLLGLTYGFARADNVGCVSGLVLPARLDTRVQELFEQFGGHCKDRGFVPAVFSRYGSQSPLYPLPPFGVGANMAFRREALADIGGFDVALGAGTPAHAGEDTLAMTLILLASYRIVYEPAALMWHHHREDLDSLRRQLRGYGVGLTAFYAALLRHRPSVIPALLALAPTAVGYLRKGKGTSTVLQELPAELKLRQRWWMLAGPVAYLKSLRKQALIAASANGTDGLDEHHQDEDLERTG
jgi:glycosyltransferase involved in cell wall biosynthesis